VIDSLHLTIAKNMSLLIIYLFITT